MLWRKPAFALLMLSTAGAAPVAAAGRYDDIVQAYFRAEFAAHPVSATSLGLHAGDARVDETSADFHTRNIARLHATVGALRALDSASLSPAVRDDRDILAAQIDGDLLFEETLATWRHNPDTYVGLATNAVYSLITRDFAPAQERLRDAIAREQAIPAIFADARTNLRDMPPVFVDIGIENAEGAASFLSKDVPDAFASVKDAGLRRQFDASTKTAVAATRAFAAWLRVQKASARGSFVLGDANFRRLLAADMIDLTPEQVLAAGEAQLKRDSDDFQKTSETIDPRHPDRALADIAADHPDAAHLIATAAGQLKSVQDFVVAHKILTLPNLSLPHVAETPPFQRAEVFGEMDPPGPFETRARDAYYYITPPDPSAPKAEQENLLEYWNRSILLNLTVHETMPGHFVQFLFEDAHPEWSIVRKTAHSYTATEGWAHYTEQMMPEQGLRAGDPKLRLAQLQDALLRDCRLIGSVKMHTQGFSLADATALMKQSCKQPDSVAYKEARRGTADPGYFSYTLGKLMILKLRDDVRAHDGAKFSLTRFHDRFLGAALVPIRVIRREMLGTDGPML